MASRENLNKLRINELKQLANEFHIDTFKKRKHDIVNELLNCQISPSLLTPVVLQTSESVAITPNTKENLPPFNKVSYYKNVSRLPRISFSMIYEFIVARATASGGIVKNFKGLDRAVKHFDAGDVQGIVFAQIDESTICVKALCQASMKNHRYEVYACLTQRPSGDTIDYAFCQCPVGLAQSCSHVGGLLFTLRNAKTSDAANEQQQSCTSMLCQWKVPRSSLKPQPLKTLKPYKPRLSDCKDRAPPPQTDFDPRHSDDRNTDLGRSLQHLQKLRSVFPNTGMTLLWNIPDDVPAANQEVEVTTMVNPMYSRMENMLFTENNVPPAEIDIELVNFIETSTRGQRLSEMWRKLHIGRLTSSIFGDVLGIKSQPNSLVKRIMEGSCLERW
ncbi:hypothetical protein KUTeg_016055, partial [Tegillarca granosa]